MNSYWQKIERAVAQASEMPSAEFKKWLEDFCRGDARLKDEIRSLLAVQTEAENFLEKSVGEYAAAILPAAENDFAGKFFGKYKILREVGRGGMGAVFLAERTDGEFEQKVALKIVRQTFLDNELERHFKRERQILAALNHPNIAKLLDGGVSAHGEPYLVMEFIEGDTLLKFAEKQALDTRRRLKIFLKICRAVAFAHRNLIVHRDLKPSNILVTRDGEPKLIDFGLAKLTETPVSPDGVIETRTAFRALTPAYASPEQLEGKNVTTASDIYSLGKIFSEFIKTSNGELRNIAAMAAREEPERRYPSVEAFAEDLENFLDGKPVKARPATLRYRAAKFARRNKTAVAAAALFVLAILTGLIAALWQAENARRQRDLANAQKQKAERVSQFLSAALAYSDPSAALPGARNQRDATINQMLEDLAPRIETELADQPDVQATLHRTVGFAYLSQSRFADAEKYLSAALERQRAVYGENHRETAHTIYGAAIVREALGDYAAAEEKLRRVIEIYRAEAPTELVHNKVFVGALTTLGNILWSKGEYAAAEPVYNEALTVAVTLAGENGELVADAKTGLGINRYALGKLDEAATFLGDAIAEYRDLPSARWKMPVALNHFGQVLLWKGEFDRALAALDESAALGLELRGEGDYDYARSLWLGVYALCFKGECAAARKNLEKIERFANRYYPTNKAVAANNADARNVFLTRTGQLTEGEISGRKAVELYQSVLTRGSNSVTLARMNLADNLMQQKKFAEARAVLLEARREASEVQGAEHWRVKQVEQRLARLDEIAGGAKLKTGEF
jgi:eukaryotic-like serine/threonine-protein kinase